MRIETGCSSRAPAWTLGLTRREAWDYGDNQLVVQNLVDDAVLSDADAPEVFGAPELDAPRRTRVTGERQQRCRDLSRAWCDSFANCRSAAGVKTTRYAAIQPRLPPPTIR
jgi:hypothetical protein